MADESIRIPIEIDTSKGLAQVVTFSRQASKDIGAIGGNRNNNGIIDVPFKFNNAQVLAAIKQIKSEAASIKEIPDPFKKIVPGANQAQFAMVNLGRVVQDAPFGFLGIANNLNPLLESFQRLKATTGTTGGALKALGSSLMGAGGLGFALSIVSTALILFGDKLFGSSKKADEAKDAIQKYKDAVKSIFEGAGREAADTAGLVGILKSETETRERKILALKELKAIQPEIFGQLKLEGDAVAGLDVAYKNYLENMRTVIAVKIKQAQLEGKITELLKSQGQTLTASEKTFVDGIKNLQKALVQPKGIGGDINFGYKDRLDKEEKEGKGKIKNIQADIDGLLKDITELSKGIDVKKEGAKGKDPFDDLIKRAKELADFFDKTTIREFKFEVNPLDAKEQTAAKARNFIQQALDPIERGKFPVKPKITVEVGDLIKQTRDEVNKRMALIPFASFANGQIPIRLLPKIDLTEFQKLSIATVKEESIKTYDELRKGIESRFSNVKSVRALFPVELQVLLTDQEKAEAEFKAKIDAIKQSIVGIAGDLVSGIGEQIGNALSGGDLRAGFRAFVNIIAQGFSSIGKQMIAAAPIITALKAAIKTLNPSILLPAGLALVAIGAALRNTVAGGVKGFAQGGLAFGPILGMIGEGRGTSRNNPEVIAPLNQLKSFFGNIINDGARGRSGTTVGTAPAFNLSIPDRIELFASGQNLVGAIALENKSQGRAF